MVASLFYAGDSKETHIAYIYSFLSFNVDGFELSFFFFVVVSLTLSIFKTVREFGCFFFGSDFYSFQR